MMEDLDGPQFRILGQRLHEDLAIGFSLRWPADLPARPLANRTWGEERIAAELLVKLGIRVSPRTVRRYMPPRPPRTRRGTQVWSTFVRNHATVGARQRFRCRRHRHLPRDLRVCRAGSRYSTNPHWNVTANPTADWTAQQFRM